MEKPMNKLKRLSKQLFKWFFCNLFYYYANKSLWLDKLIGIKKSKRPSDKEVIFSISILMMFPVVFAIYFLTFLFNLFPKTHSGARLFGISTGVIALLIFATMFNRLFYRNKKYLKMMEGFTKEDYNKYIVIITIFFFIVLPGALVYLYAQVLR